MVKHHPDLIMCLKAQGTSIGKLCEKCEGKCPLCDSYSRPFIITKICNDCSYGGIKERCLICGNIGISDAYYCYECCILEKDRDGCPRIINLGSSRTDLFYEKKKFKFNSPTF